MGYLVAFLRASAIEEDQNLEKYHIHASEIPNL